MRAPILRSLLAVFVVGAAVWALSAAGASGQEYPLPLPPAPAGPLPKLQPFPQVRISGSANRRGARITRLTVKAKVGVTIASRCYGGRSKRCPSSRVRRQLITGTAGTTRTIHVKRFERRLRGGARLRLFIAREGRTGKFTSIQIRRGRVPTRRDRCVRGMTMRVITCP